MRAVSGSLPRLNLPSGPDTCDCIDAVTTNKTDFFREPQHFRYLASKILPQVAPLGRIALWSASCSSGEEPYTLAMVLSEYASSHPPCHRYLHQGPRNSQSRHILPAVDGAGACRSSPEIPIAEQERSELPSHQTRTARKHRFSLWRRVRRWQPGPACSSVQSFTGEVRS